MRPSSSSEGVQESMNFPVGATAWVDLGQTAPGDAIPFDVVVVGDGGGRLQVGRVEWARYTRCFGPDRHPGDPASYLPDPAGSFATLRFELVEPYEGLVDVYAVPKP